MRNTARVVWPGIVVAVVGWIGGCRAAGDRTGVALFPDMSASVPYDAYDRNSVTASGGTQLLPPAGTVPLGGELCLFGTGPEEALRAGQVLSNPLQPTAENLARGGLEYAHKCQVCHGPEGQGDGPIIGRFPNPPILSAEHARNLPDGQIYHIISRGQGIMPSHAAQVLPADRWRLVLHIRQLQAEMPLVASPPPLDTPVSPATAAGPLGTEVGP